MDIIKSILTASEVYSGLADCAHDVADAANAYSDAIGGSDPTPEAEAEAYEQFCHAVAAFKLYYSLVDVSAAYVSYITKVLRSRLEAELTEKADKNGV